MNNTEISLTGQTSRRPADDRESGWDCVSQMQRVRKRPDILASMLREMGVSESGDGIPDDDI